MEPAMRNQVLHAELADVRQQLRRLQKQTANAKRKKQGRVLRHGQGWRCSPSSPPCLVVLEYSGGIADVAADFVQGRGCWKKRTFVAAASGICSGERRQLVSDIESAYDTAPLSQIARLCGNPVQAGLVSGAQMLKILRWLMERSLTAWVEEQNAVHGVAPSRAQLVEQALCAIPALAPQFYQQKLRSLLVTTPRSQRRWLATFRLRWGLRIGKLKLCSHLSVQEKQSKEHLGQARFWLCLGKPKLGAYPGNNSISKYNPIANPFLGVSGAPVFGCVFLARLWLISNGSTQPAQPLLPIARLC